jgi:hypothetical protein
MNSRSSLVKLCLVNGEARDEVLHDMFWGYMKQLVHQEKLQIRD